MSEQETEQIDLEPAEILKTAETDDEVYIEYDYPDEGGIVGVRGKVANVSDYEQPDGTVLRVFFLETEHATIHLLDLRLFFDPNSAACRIDDTVVEMRFPYEESDEREIQDIHTLEVSA